MDHTEISCIEWCFGTGGNHRGLKRVIPNLRLVAISEIDAYAAANVVAKMEAGHMDAAPNWTDCRTFPCELFIDRIALFVASYPCQPFSVAGLKKGLKDPRNLIPYILRALEIMRPKKVFFENVEGHIKKGLRHVISELEKRGYRCAWGIFSAEECGSSHRRKRVFILGELADAGHAELSGRQPVEKQRYEARTGRIQLPPDEPPSLSRAMADADCGRFKQRASKGEPVFVTGGISSDVADSARFTEQGNDESLYAGQYKNGAGFENGGDPMEHTSLPSKKRQQQLRESVSGQAGRKLADAIGAGFIEQGGGIAVRQEHTAAERGLPHFPPGPGLGAQGTLDQIIKLHRKDPAAAWQRFKAELENTLAWKRIIEIDPSLEPAICRMADGMANRVDRLRLTGNGVVPDTAALAWLILNEKLK